MDRAGYDKTGAIVQKEQDEVMKGVLLKLH